eukprot:2129477-Rhodomonas_salina.1
MPERGCFICPTMPLRVSRNAWRGALCYSLRLLFAAAVIRCGCYLLSSFTAFKCKCEFQCECEWECDCECSLGATACRRVDQQHDARTDLERQRICNANLERQ